MHVLISEQIKDVEECLITFEGFLRAAVIPASADETLRSLAAGVAKAENTADVSLRRMIDSLSGQYLPATRQDLIALATSCDRVANKCEHIAKSMVTRRVRFPEGFGDDLIEIVSLTKQQFTILEQSITLLFTQLGSFLKDHHILDEIRALESRVDVIEEKLYEKIYAMDLDVANQDRLAGMLELICDSSDIIENIADQIQIMLITRKA
ncbi:MAG: DUF47 family protein [Clostridia bacterium]|nr:DUF47 family protein [Clostridia bacterium]